MEEKKSSVSRREFLKRTVSGGVGLLILTKGQMVWSYQANSKLDIAIIGAGGRGWDNLNEVRGENIIALCDVDERQAGEAFRQFPNVPKYYDFRRMLEEKGRQIDAVVVSTPDHTHAVASVMAMKMGKHLFCEKPLARTVYEARVMRETAAKNKVVTQMGNQGTASEGFRRSVELVQAGVIGEVREVHAWLNGGNSPADRPKETPPVPPTLQWDLWLGPAPYRPYHPAYLPGGWRNWRDFGTGALGDFGCHTMNVAFRALKLNELWTTHRAGQSPLIRVEAKASEVHPETYSRWVVIHYEFPARGSLPPVKLTWYNGGPRPPQDLFMGHPVPGGGCLLVGSKGSLLSTDPWNTGFVLLPQRKFEGFQGPPQTLPRSPGHHREWIEACKGGPKPMSSLDYGGPLTEMVLLGNVAVLVGHPIEFDPLKGRIVNCSEANRFLHREYRRGWRL